MKSETVTSNLTVQSVLNSTCLVSANNLNFGTIEVSDGITAGTSVVTTQCNKNAPYTLEILDDVYGDGWHYLMGAAHAQKINYGMCKNSAVYSCAGNSGGNAMNVVYSYTGTGANQTLTLYAYVVNGYNYTPDNYSATLRILVSYLKFISTLNICFCISRVEIK